MCFLTYVCLYAFFFVSVSNAYIIGSHPSATHFVEDRTDIYHVTQTVLNALNNQGGGKVTIANGTYILSKNLELYDNIHLSGMGMYETTLKLIDFAQKFDKAGFIRSVRTRNIIVSDITLDGNKHHQIIDGIDNDISENASYADSTRYGRYGLFTEGCDNVIFDNVRVMSFQGYGFDPHGQKQTNTYGTSLTISNCLSTNNDWDGFTIDQSVNVLVNNCISQNNGRHGFNIVTGSYHVFIENSLSISDGFYYTNGTGCGVSIQNNQGYPTNSVSVNNVTVVRAKKAGICVEGVRNITLTKNQITGRDCMRIDTSADMKVLDNTCVNSNGNLVIDYATVTNLQLQNTQFIRSNTPMNTQASRYIGRDITIVVGYSSEASVRVRVGTDAYPIIQEALDEIAANGVGKIIFEAGIYSLSSYIQVSSNTTIEGAGISDTVLRLQDFASPWWIPNTGNKRSGFLRATSNCDNLVFRGFTLDGNKANQNTDTWSKYGRYGLFTEACHNVLVDSVEIRDFQGYGFDPHGVKVPAQWSIGLTIVNSIASNNDWDGFTIDQSANVLLKNNTAYSNGRHGFNIVTGTYDILLENNTATDNGYYYYLAPKGCGIAVQNNLNFMTRNVLVTRNYAINNSDSGICVNDVQNITIKDNIVMRSNNITCIKLTQVTGTTDNNMCVNATEPLPPLPQLPDLPDLPVVNTSLPKSNVVTSSAEGHIQSTVVYALTIILMWFTL